MFKSIRWRLQLWDALVLLLVTSSFGSILYFQIRQARLDEIDGELHAAARVLEGSLRGMPPHLLGEAPDPFADPFRLPPPTFAPKDAQPFPPKEGSPFPPKEGSPFPPKDGPPFMPKGPHPPGPDHFERLFSLPEHFRQQYGDGERLPYFVIQDAKHRVIKSSQEAEDIPAWEGSLLPSDSTYRVRQRGPFREIMLMGPFRTTILVGRSVEIELEELSKYAWRIGVTGVGVLSLGLAGGWFLSRRVLRPIDRMSKAAAAISASNLSRRIDVGETDNELGQLARVLNDTFTRLEAAFEQQVRFTADASHELRTPLSVVLSHTELAMNRQRSPEEYRESLKTCHRAAQRMRGLIESLLTLARMDSGEIRLAKRSLDLGKTAKECADMLRPLVEEKGLHLDTEVQKVFVQGDEEQLSRVVTNLLTNAITYNRQGGRITLRVKVLDGDCVLSVVDTGIGIPQEDLPHIFERFYRVDKARSRAAGGSGLGLAICKCIIDAHDGVISVASEVGKGTKFVIRLPLSKDTAFRAEREVGIIAK